MKGKLPQPGSEAALRQFFGFSQTYFARYLGITRSQLSMVELGQRELPMSALLKYTELVLLAHGKEGLATQPPIALPPLTDKERNDLLWLAKGADIEAEKCRRELVAMQQAFQQASHGHAFCTQKLASLQLSKNGTVPQTMLQWKMDGHLNSAARARELAGE